MELSSQRSDDAAFLQTLADRSDIPGLGFVRIEGSGSTTVFIGDAVVGARALDAGSVFEAASLSKPLVAYLTLRLVDEGKLDLDAPLLSYVPTLPLPAADPRSAGVTLRSALSHSTGLTGDETSQLTFTAEPGSTFAYYPAGYRLVQRVIEAVEDMPFNDVMQREVFDPLGMTDSSFVWRDEFAPRFAARHDALGAALSRRPGPDAPANAAASLLTTPKDYGRFLAAVLDGEGLLPSAHAAMLTPQIEVTGTGGRVKWGLGWGLEPSEGRFFHYGDDGAAKSYVAGSLTGRRAVAYFANTTYGLAPAREIVSSAFPGPQPGIDWIDYPGIDDPVRLARRDLLRAYVEGGVPKGLETFNHLTEQYPDLDFTSLVGWVGWALDSRSLAAEKAGLQTALANWQMRKPADPR
ncbi:serine hydrolase domain-containing protein [Brevundimonas subvibrioides]|uniref:serine hydrolase domain-containing protein n=1 Tax=Brevundimonas subvibrioides TaxID=74313 RepID=UPI0032D5A5C3